MDPVPFCFTSILNSDHSNGGRRPHNVGAGERLTTLTKSLEQVWLCGCVDVGAGGWGGKKRQRGILSPRVSNTHKIFTVSKVFSHILFSSKLIPSLLS